MEHASYDNEKAEKQPKTYQRKKEDHEFDLLIDIQKKLAQGKGKYYVRFAKIFNTKQVAKVVLYLKQHDIQSYDVLEKNVKTATERFTEISASIKAKEKRLAEIQVLKKHIFDYFKTKDVYADYRKCGYSKKFLEEHRQDILLPKVKNSVQSMPISLQKRKSCTVNIVRLRKICRRFKEQNMISISSLKVMKRRRRNVSENTISLDNSIWGICRFHTCRFPSFFISEENSNGKIK